MPSERTIPHRLLAALGWLYELTGRDRCDICGGPLPAGEMRVIELSKSDEKATTTVRLDLCANCDDAHLLRETPHLTDYANALPRES